MTGGESFALSELATICADFRRAINRASLMMTGASGDIQMSAVTMRAIGCQCFFRITG